MPDRREELRARLTEAQIALARRAVAAPGWRRLHGMRFVRPDGGLPLRMVAEYCYAHEGETGHKIQAASGLRFDDLPDLSDPLTALGLLALVRERWGTTAHCLQAVDCCWYVWVEFRLVAGANTETEALIAALEVAP